MTYQQLAITEFGPPSMLALQCANLPEPQAGEVVVKVHFAGVNPIDAKTRAGLGWAAQQNRDKLPWVPGYDIAGEVVACGEGCELPVGARVAGFIGFPLQGGGYSEYCQVPETALSLVPKGVELAQAAALPLAGQTAWQALDKAGVMAGQRVLILAGAGGVGHIAVQLAAARGAEVFATCSADNKAFVAAMGVQAVDYRAGALDSQIAPVDCLIDLMGGDVGLQALTCVKPGGMVVTVPTITAEAVCEKAISLGLQAEGMLVSPSVAQNGAMLTMLSEGQLVLKVAAVFPLDDGIAAHEQIESGHTQGKLLLMMPAAAVEA